jgi:monofunctional biosynthetic peptidoglycan transglycosylase
VDPGLLVLFDLARPGDRARFAPIDDAVMGGRSWSRLEEAPGGAAFTGQVSLEDGGGFASIRSAPRQVDLSGRAGLALGVRGDGHRYKLGLRTDAAFDGVTWQAAFAPRAQVWTEVRLPFATFEPRFRGRAVEAGPLDLGRVTAVGLLVSDHQEGPFRLEVAWIAAY